VEWCAGASTVFLPFWGPSVWRHVRYRMKLRIFCFGCNVNVMWCDVMSVGAFPVRAVGSVLSFCRPPPPEPLRTVVSRCGVGRAGWLLRRVARRFHHLESVVESACPCRSELGLHPPRPPHPRCCRLCSTSPVDNNGITRVLMCFTYMCSRCSRHFLSE